MPRKKRDFEEQSRPKLGDLDERLAEELKSSRVSGQPVIDEVEFPSGKLRINVIWDAWDRIPLEDRTAIILRAYRRAEGPHYLDRIALASGLTVPEAYGAGMLPFQIIPALRRTDPLTLEQCHRAMIDEGASVLFGSDKPQLRFATQEEAEACRSRLTQRLPDSEPVWVITQEMGRVEDWAQV